MQINYANFVPFKYERSQLMLDAFLCVDAIHISLHDIHLMLISIEFTHQNQKITLMMSY